MRNLRIAAFIGLVAVAATIAVSTVAARGRTAAAQTLRPSFKAVLESYGLGRLSKEEMAKVQALVDSRTAPENTAPTPAAPSRSSLICGDTEMYFRNKGFTLEYVTSGEITGKFLTTDVLIVGQSNRYYTESVPLMLRRIPGGFYLTKRGIRGISEILYQGTIEELYIARWEEWPPKGTTVR